MKVAVIDIGSNSARLMLSENGVTLYKISQITALAKDMGEELLLKPKAIETTFSVVSFFIDKAKKDGAEKIYAFATAAVRTSKNKDFFVSEFYKNFGINLDVVSGDYEAELGLLGALKGKDGAIIDIGGASTEITVCKNSNIIYKKSLPYGCVKVTDICGQDKNVLDIFCRNFVLEYGDVPFSNFYGIGGTATSMASISLELKVYDSKIINRQVLTYNGILSIIDKIFTTPIDKRNEIIGLQKGRERVIGTGAIILKNLMEYLKIKEITISEDDNLEGYLLKGKYE